MFYKMKLGLFICCFILINNFQLYGQIYKYENDTLTQRIRINKLDENKIKFKLDVENKKLSLHSVIKGIASKHWGLEPIDPTESGLDSVYYAKQYIYDKSCWLNIKIDSDLSNNIIIIEADDCLEYRCKYCPFESQGLLKKIEESDAKQGED